MDITVWFDKDVRRVILKAAHKERRDPNEVVNDLLRKDLVVARVVQ